MNAIKLREGIYEVGAADWNLRNFHGYSTDRGVTYNAYLIIDEKITLVDTVKEHFADELLARISEIVDPAKIDYIISNHVEMDHSGALPKVMKAAPNATIITSSPNGLKGLLAHYGEYHYQAVKAGDVLSIGSRTLQFVPTPMLHWPDNMVTYCPEEKILFSNDAFGQHYATSKKFDDQEDLPTILFEAEKYYANIIMPFSPQVNKTLEVVKGLEIDMIATSHGLIWRKYVKEIIERYAYFASDIPDEKAVVVYDSMWNSTERMARAIVEGFAKKDISVKLYDLKRNHISDIVTDVLKAKYVAVGSPTLNNNMLPGVAGFLTYLKGLAPKNKKAFAFGSYGWSGQSIGLVNEELQSCKCEIVLEPIRIQYLPTVQQLEEIEKQVEAIIL